MTRHRLRNLGFAMAALLCARASAFGPNKVRSKDFDWKLISTPHFDIYFYPEEEGLARRAALISEKGYQHNSRILDYYAKARTPLFLFENHIQFQQTNISQGVIGPGTGGFTEAFKNRMVLPTTGSDRWLETVIVHEMAHATQFNILYGEGQRSFQVFKNYVIPLWIMEGMAEYCAQNWDSFADMVLRDAVINDRLYDLDLMDGFSHLDEVYVAYKAGQSAVQYLADHYGSDSVAKLMKKYKAQISSSQILHDITGKSFSQFNREWKSALRQKYWLQSRGRESAGHYGRGLTFDTSESLTHSNGAIWSPEGRRIAFVSTRSGDEEIWVMGADGKDPHPLFSGPFQELGRSGGYGVPGSRLSWSPDGVSIAFVQVSEGRKQMVLGDVKSGKLRKLDLGQYEMEAPAFSPDGRELAFSAARGGRSEIRIVELASMKQRALRRDENFSMVTDPAWSPDGKWIAFSAEVGRKNRVYLSPSQGGGLKQLSRDGVDSLMPAFIDNGSRLLYVCDSLGAYNLASVGLDGGEYQEHSNAVTGLFSPRCSPDGAQTLFVSYEDGCQNIYVMDTPGYIKAPPSPALRALANPYLAVPGPSAGGPPPPQASPQDIPPPLSASAESEIPAPGVPEAMTPTAHYLDAEASSVSINAQDLAIQPYQTNVTPDLFFMLLGYDNYNGLVGGGYLTASDMLGDHNLSLFVNFVPGYQSVAQADYLLYHGRTDINLAAFYRNTNFFLAQINPQQFNSTFLDQDWGANLSASYPLSSFSKVEVGIGSRRLFRQLNGDAVLDPVVASTLGESYINSTNVSYVREAMTFRNFDVYGGTRLQLSTSYSDKLLWGTRNFTFYQAELRWALPLSFLSRDTVIYGRFLGLEQSGLDRNLFYFGGAQVRGLSYNEYLGEKIALGNIQIRQPYLKNINGTLWPFESLLIKDAQLVLFYDAGIAPRGWAGVKDTDVRAGYGGGLRLHTFMFEKVLLNFSLDLGQRTDKPGTTYYYFTLGQIF